MKKLIGKLIGNTNKSIVFISFHKCATSYFSGYLLKNIKGYKFIDYLQYLYENDRKVEPEIKKFDHIYGVIRLQEKHHPRYQFVEELLSHPNFSDTRQIYFTRDPRDILVSSYYSFGFTHELSNVNDLNQYEIKKRELIQSNTIDEYVLKEAEILKGKFMKMYELMEKNENTVHLKYEDMILNFDNFFDKFSTHVPIAASTYDRFFQDTRPNYREDQNMHKRSGVVGDYKNKISPGIINNLNVIFSDVLKLFNY